MNVVSKKVLYYGWISLEPINGECAGQKVLLLVLMYAGNILIADNEEHIQIAIMCM